MDTIKEGEYKLYKLGCEWCGPCKMMDAFMPDLMRDYGEKVDYVHVDLDKTPEYKDRFKVTSIPVLVLVKDEEEVERLTGGQAPPTVKEFLDKHI